MVAWLCADSAGAFWLSDWNIIKGNHGRKIVGHSAIYFLASIFSKSVGASLLPVYTHWLLPEEYAVFANLMAISGLAGVFISLYMDNAYARLFFDTDNQEEKIRTTFSTIALFLMAWGILLAVVIAWGLSGTVSSVYSLAWPYAFIVTGIPLLRQFRMLILTHYRSLHQSKRVAFVGMVFSFVNAGFAVTLLTLTEMKAGALLWATLAGELVATLLTMSWMWRDRLLTMRLNGRLLREAVVYALGLMPLTAASWATGYADRLLITWYGDLGGSGIYSVAFEIGNLVNLVTMSIFMTYGPMVMAMLQADREKNISRIEAFQSIYLHFLIGVAFFLSIFTPELFSLLVQERYHAGMMMVPVIAFGFVFSGIRKLHATLIYYHKLTFLISVGGVIQSAVIIIGNLAFIPFYGPMASAWSKMFAGVAVALYFYLLTSRYEPLRTDFRRLGDSLMVYGTSLAIVLAAMFMFELSFWRLLIVKIGVVLLAIAWTWYSPLGRVLHQTLAQRKVAAPSPGQQSFDSQ